MRIKWQPHERASILYLRKKHNYSINQLSTFFGRSTGLIHQILSFNTAIRNLPIQDLRKLPTQTKRLAAQVVRRSMDYWVKRWEGFILGTEDKPP